MIDNNSLQQLYNTRIKSNYKQHYHIMPVTGLLNDPNGFIYHDHRWKLFHQWFPYGAYHGLKHWYYLESSDLMNWEPKGCKLFPDTEYDNGGVFSGNAIEIDDRMLIYYTANHVIPETVSDDLDNNDPWIPTGKVVPYTCLAEMDTSGNITKHTMPLFGPAPGYTHNQRDPKIVYDDNTSMYYLLLGAEADDHHGRIIVYESKEYDSGWAFKGELSFRKSNNREGDSFMKDFGNMWECPSLVKIGSYDVLIFCPQNLKLENRGNAVHHNGYLIGKLDLEKLTFEAIDDFKVLDHGFDFYAAQIASTPNTYTDSQENEEHENTIMMAWMGLPDVTYPTDKEGWSGCLTLPRKLSIENGKLRQVPAVDLCKNTDMLCKPISVFNINLFQDDADSIQPVSKQSIIHIEIEDDNKASKDFKLRLLCDKLGRGGLKLSFNSESLRLTMDRSEMAVRFNTELGEVRYADLEKTLKSLDIFLDSSSVEIFVNDGEAVFTSRIFPTEEERYITLN